MSIPRVIPSMLLENGLVYKGQKFKKHKYVGEPSNIIKIFNEKEIDELVVFDRTARVNGIDFITLRDISTQSFFPLSYGGGINTVEDAERIINIGYEKIIINTALFTNTSLVSELVGRLGSSSVVACLDYSQGFWGRRFFICNGKKKIKKNLQECMELATRLSVGEVILNSIDLDGTLKGLDVNILNEIGLDVNIPIVLSGGARSEDDVLDAIACGASGVAVGELFTHVPPHRSVLIRYLSKSTLLKIERGI